VAAVSSGAEVSSADRREARKAVARLDRQLTKLGNREAELHAQLVEHAADYEKLAELDAQLSVVRAEKEAVEEEWLEAASLLE
jgi:ATP-binding cassette subfamily F protein uup